jgi:hypothetical protein
MMSDVAAPEKRIDPRAAPGGWQGKNGPGVLGLTVRGARETPSVRSELSNRG